MFSIRKKHKVQILFYRDLLWSGRVLDDFTCKDENIPEWAVNLARMQCSWAKKRIKWTLHDIYTIPKFEDLFDVIEFIKTLEWETWDNHTEWKEWVIRDIILAYNLAISYLEKEGYYIPNMWSAPKSGSDLVRITNKWYKFTSARDRIGYCTLLKEILWFFRIIRFKDFTVNYETWVIDLRNKDFIKRIIDIFNSDNFHYRWNDSIQFSNDSTEMRWTIIEDWREVAIYAWFDVKTINALIEKMDWQEKYNLPEAFNDIHRMRIEVPDTEGILRVGKVLFKKFWWLTLENVGWLLSNDEISSYCREFLLNEDEQGYKLALLNTSVNKTPEKKAYSEDRKELKLKWWNPPIEIQIVLVNNHNETGYAHHDVYKIRRKIAAKIRRHWWIWLKWIEKIISMVFQASNWTIPFTEEQIKQHILWLKWFLIPIRWVSEWEYRWKIENLRVNHWTTTEVLQKYSQNYPNVTKRDPVSILLKDDNNWLNGLVWVSQVYSSSASTHSSSLQPRRQGQWFLMDDQTKRSLDQMTKK